jgi:DNA-binding XRE family transcriptional regulator
MTVTTFTANDKTFVVIPLEDYEALRRAANDRAFADEDADDEAFAAQAALNNNMAILNDRHLAMSAAEWARIHAGEAAIKVIRQHRGLSQQALAGAAGIAQPQLSAMESGKRGGTVQTLKRLADALRVPMDALVSDSQASDAETEN